jgi:hypothetical protein
MIRNINKQYVKISKIKIVDGKVVKEKQYNTFGDSIPDRPVTEDVVCEVLHWGRQGDQDSEGRWYYYDVMWLRRTDDGTVEWAMPESVVFLDTLNKNTGIADDPSGQYPNAK